MCRDMRAWLVLVFVWAVAAGAAASMLKPVGGGAGPLSLQSLRGDAWLDGPFARSRTVMVFHNPSERQTEADFFYTAPPGSVVHYFAYWYRKEKVVARIVERERAAGIYRSITDRGRDPALVESLGHRRFRVRIFPINPTEDLKVEVGMTQVLPSSAAGFVYTFPFQAEDVPRQGIGSVDLAFHVAGRPDVRGVANNYGLVGSPGAGGASTLRLQATRFRPHGDLTITQQVAPRIFQAFVQAARSGGARGFFALVLKVGHRVKAPRVHVDGPGVREVVIERLPSIRANGSLLVTGRYHGAGQLSVRMEGVGQARVPLENGVVVDNPAALLWAASRIGELEEKPGAEAAVKALSHRFNVPSKYTSWLAVPREEWARFQRMRAEARRYEAERRRDREACQRLVPFIEQGRFASAQAVALYRRLYEFGLIGDLQRALADRWADRVSAGQSEWPDARRVRDFLFTPPGAVQPNIHAIEEAFTERLARMICDGTQGSARFARLRETLVSAEARLGCWPKADDAATRRRKAEAGVTATVANYVHIDMGRWAEAYGRHVAQGREKGAAALDLRRRVQRANRNLAPRHRMSDDEFLRLAAWGAELSSLAEQLVSARHQHPADPELIGMLDKRLRRMCRTLRQSSRELQQLAEARWEASRLSTVHGELRRLYATVPRDPEEERRVEQEYARLDRRAPEIIERMRVNVELEGIERQVRRGGETGADRVALERRREYLVAKAEEFRARFGDPLIQVEAPADALQVTAILPDGELKPLAYNPRTARWEAHFDIPTHQGEGRYTIQVIVVGADGGRTQQSLAYEVRLAAPGADAIAKRLDRSVLMLACVPSSEGLVRRVVALLPWGERVELTADAAARRWSARVDIPPAHQDGAFSVGFIVTDAAHNRKEVMVECAAP